MLTYLLLSILMLIFKPEIGEYIASSVGIDGFFLWVIGFIIAMIFD